MKAQIYVKSTEDNTSLVIGTDNGNAYYKKVLPYPEITAIQRGVSFVKHQLAVEATEIYPDKLNADEVVKDAYIKFCKVNAVKGECPIDKFVNLCRSQFQVHGISAGRQKE